MEQNFLTRQFDGTHLMMGQVELKSHMEWNGPKYKIWGQPSIRPVSPFGSCVNMKGWSFWISA